MFRIDQHPNEAEEYRQSRDQVSKSAQARVSGIEHFAFVSDDDEVPVFHSRSLAGTEHEEEKVDNGEREEAHTVDSNNAFVSGETLRGLSERGQKEDRIDGGNDRYVGQTGQNSRYDQLALVFRESKWQGMRCFVKVKLGLMLVSNRDDCSLRFTICV